MCICYWILILHLLKLSHFCCRDWAQKIIKILNNHLSIAESGAALKNFDVDMIIDDPPDYIIKLIAASGTVCINFQNAHMVYLNT